MSAYLNRFGEPDPRVDVIPIRLRYTHVMHARGGWRVHRLSRVQAQHAEYDRTAAYRITGMTACNQIAREGDHLGTADSLVAAGGVLCPRCHPCRCATPCTARQCVCSTRCQTCAPGQDGACRFTRSPREQTA